MADEDYQNTDVYRERDTGKIRIKSQAKIELMRNSPTMTESEKLDEIIELLTALGANPES
jgi:hypothetical protein